MLEVEAADLAGCLAAAVEGVADALADVPADAPRRRAGVDVAGPEPDALLLGVLDEVVARLDIDGELGVTLLDPIVEGGRLRGSLDLVPLSAVEVTGMVPKAVTWHGLTLDQDSDGRWRGRVMLDL